MKRGLVARVRDRLRWMGFNRTPGIQVARSARIAKSAMLQLESDGHHFGGRIVVGPGVTLSDGVVLATYGGSIELDEGVYVGPYCVLYGHGGLVVGRDVSIGAHTVIVPANHGFERVDLAIHDQPLSRKGIRIEADVWIGAHCTVLDGAHLGHGAVIGGGAVVRGEIEEFGVAVGVPARVIRNRRASIGASSAGSRG